MVSKVPKGSRRISVWVVAATLLAFAFGIAAVMGFGDAANESTVVYDSTGERLTLAEATAEPFCLTSDDQVGVILRILGYSKTNEELHVNHRVDAWTPERNPVGFVDRDQVTELKDDTVPLHNCEDVLTYGPPPSR
jgi:hypothetical protein